jgi:hypothetical protein
LVSKNIPPTFTLWSIEAYSTGQALPLEGGICEKNEPGTKASFVARGRGNFLPSKPGGRYKAVKHCPVFRRATSALAETLINPNRGSLGFGEFDTERATEK